MGCADRAASLRSDELIPPNGTDEKCTCHFAPIIQNKPTYSSECYVPTEKCDVAVVVVGAAVAAIAAAKQYPRSETAYPKWNPQSLVVQLRKVNGRDEIGHLGVLDRRRRKGNNGHGQTRNAVFHTKCNEFPGPFPEMVFFQHAKRKLYTATGGRERATPNDVGRRENGH